MYLLVIKYNIWEGWSFSVICILVLLPLNALVSRARDFHDQTCAADSVNEPAWPVLALGPGTLSWDDGAFFGRHCVPSAASRLSLMDFFYAQLFWSTLDLWTESPVKCFWQIWDQFVGLKSDLVPWCKVSTSFCQARLRFLSRGNVEKSKSGFFTIFRVQPPTTHDRGIFTYPGWNQWNEISAHLWTKLRHVRYMFSWHERTQIHMYMTECPTSLRMMSQGSRAYN